jgi:hypothetical protein
MPTYLSSLLGALFVALPISYYGATESPCMASALNDYISTRPNFHLLFFFVAASIGLLFLTSNNRHHPLSKFSSWIAPKVGGFYASAAGTILGWSFGICWAHLLASPRENWLPALALASISLLLVTPPLIGLNVVTPVANEFKQRWQRPMWRVRAVQACGFALLIATSISAWEQFV